MQEYSELGASELDLSRVKSEASEPLVVSGEYSELPFQVIVFFEGLIRGGMSKELYTLQGKEKEKKKRSKCEAGGGGLAGGGVLPP